MPDNKTPIKSTAEINFSLLIYCGYKFFPFSSTADINFFPSHLISCSSLAHLMLISCSSHAEYRRHPSTDLVEAYRPVFWAIISTQRLTTSVDPKFPCGHDKHSLRSYRQELEELQVFCSKNNIFRISAQRLTTSLDPNFRADTINTVSGHIDKNWRSYR